MAQAVRFVGVRTAAFEAMAALYRDVLRLEPTLERPGAAWFRTVDGTAVHLYAEDDADHAFFGVGPVVGFLVEDFEATRGVMIARGIEFLGEPQRDGGAIWNHYRGPDGNVYELMGSS